MHTFPLNFRMDSQIRIITFMWVDFYLRLLAAWLQIVELVSEGWAQEIAGARRNANLTGSDKHEFSVWSVRRCDARPSVLDKEALRYAVVDGGTHADQTLQVAGEAKRVLRIGCRVSGSGVVSQVLYFRDVTHETVVDHIRSELLSTAAHELRTPMASFLGFSEVLLHQDLEVNEQREFLGFTHKQSKLLAEILDDLLDLARIEARQRKDFRCGKLRQAVLNVLSSDYKYSPDGGPVVLSVDTQNQAGTTPRTWIYITDHGIGMTPEQVDRVCERFCRVDTSGKTLGTGLGLRTVKGIIKLHGCELSISGVVGSGTSVSLCLPG